jgi:hypothetical protein
MAMTCGDSFLNTFDVCHPLNVLYIQAEGDMSETKDRFVNATQEAGVNWNPDKWRHYFPAALALDQDLDKNSEPVPGGLTDLINRINTDGFRPDVIVTDPLYMSMSGDLIDNKACRNFQRNIRKIKETFNCAVLIVHHEHRAKTDKFNNTIDEGDDAIFGSSMWKNFASHILKVTICNERGNPINPDKQGDIKYRKLTCATQRSGNVLKSALLQLCEDPLMVEMVGIKPSGSMVNNVLEFIQNKDSVAACDVSKEMGIGESTARNCFGILKKENKIKILSRKGKKVLYCINNDIEKVNPE